MINFEERIKVWKMFFYQSWSFFLLILESLFSVRSLLKLIFLSRQLRQNEPRADNKKIISKNQTRAGNGIQKLLHATQLTSNKNAVQIIWKSPSTKTTFTSTLTLKILAPTLHVRKLIQMKYEIHHGPIFMKLKLFSFCL